MDMRRLQIVIFNSIPLIINLFALQNDQAKARHWLPYLSRAGESNDYDYFLKKNTAMVSSIKSHNVELNFKMSYRTPK